MKNGRFIPLLFLLLAVLSCQRDGLDLTLTVGPYGKETRKVMLLYEAGFNTLGGYISENIAALQEGYLPGNGRNDDILLVFSHVTRSYRNYAKETEPALIRLYQVGGEPRSDTLQVWPAGTSVANAPMVTEVLDLVRETFPASGYGAVFSSHASGWLPDDYYSNPKKYEGKDRRRGSIYWTPPRLNSFGQEYYAAGTKKEEIELHDFAAAIPYKLDYILFDACLMASVEVAWQLRDACAYIGAAPCEIPAAGFNYKTLAHHLLEQKIPDLQGACADYFAQYEHDSTYGAAITMVDCSRLDPLASVCRVLFDRYHEGILNLKGENVQVYDRLMGGKQYLAFFDLKDLLREAGASESDLADLQSALDEAIVYEAHTPRFIELHLDRCCGLSVYLPAYPDYKADVWHGTAFLDGFYKENVAWNEATQLVL